MGSCNQGMSTKCGILKGVRLNALAELTDLVPTIEEICIGEIEPGVQGRSLADVLTGDKNPEEHRDSIYCEYYEAMPWHTQPQAYGTMVYDGRYKLSRFHTSKEGELYDLKEDPDEFRNLWDDPDYREVKIRMLELLADRMADTVEIECTTLYSLRQAYAARMLLFALVDLFLITVFLSMVSVTMQVQASELIIQFFLPFNVTCCICFRSLYSRQRRSELSALFLCTFWVTFWVRIVLADRIYNAITLPVWGLLLMGSVLWLYGCIRKVWKNCGVLPVC